ncbi:MAG: hypothetical protein IPH11_15610 [Ignavibacteriales bacterium]|nr:hypothetical protein [Ignavibacteriales bacterium]
MVKKVSRKRIDYSKFEDFLSVSKNFIAGAELAVKSEYYNAAGLLIIHAAIAIADAITIRFSSTKCSGENHYEVIKLLKETAPRTRDTQNALNHFEKLIDHKNAVSYQGDIYVKQDIEQLLKHFDRFSNWAYSLLKN